VTAHTHTEHVEGCFRCDLSREDARYGVALERANACRQEYGEAHDAHMGVNDECPWCGMYRENGVLHLSDADALMMEGNQ
jgi:hypothetical protein